MSKISMINGGPAFPIIIARETDTKTGAVTKADVFTGLSLRDYFAAQALPAVVAATCAGQHDAKAAAPSDTTELAMARDAYRLADAMLAARSPSEPLNAGTQGVEVGDETPRH